MRIPFYLMFQYFSSFFLLLSLASCMISDHRVQGENDKVPENESIVFFEFDGESQEFSMFYQDENGKNYSSLSNVKKAVEDQDNTVLMIMNGGMYLKDQSPQGLYVENGVEKNPLDLQEEAYGNFYMQPNGVFYFTKEGKFEISESTSFENQDILYATQSGPMLLIDGKKHSRFTQDSNSKHYRNGVGILPNGNPLFAISTEEVNFFDFANFFQEKGCKNALYLDGFVSRAFIPSKEKWDQGGQFGVILAVFE